MKNIPFVQGSFKIGPGIQMCSVGGREGREFDTIIGVETFWQRWSEKASVSKLFLHLSSSARFGPLTQHSVGRPGRWWWVGAVWRREGKGGRTPPSRQFKSTRLQSGSDRDDYVSLCGQRYFWSLLFYGHVLVFSTKCFENLPPWETLSLCCPERTNDDADQDSVNLRPFSGSTNHLPVLSARPLPPTAAPMVEQWIWRALHSRATWRS